MSQAAAAAAGDASFKLPAQVTVAQAPELARQALRALAGSSAPWRVDAGELQGFDSACLALLMELRRRAAGGGLEVLRVPERLRTLAHAYGVGFVLDAGAPDTTLAEDLADAKGAGRS